MCMRQAFCVGHLSWSSQHHFEVGSIILILKMKRLRYREGKRLAQLHPMVKSWFLFRSGWLPGPCSFPFTLCFPGVEQSWTHYICPSETLSQIAMIHKKFFGHEKLLTKSGNVESANPNLQVIGMILVYFSFSWKRERSGNPLSLGV